MGKREMPFMRANLIRVAVLLTAFVVLTAFISLTAGAVVSLYLAAFLWGVDAAAPLGLALAALSISAVMLILNQGGTAEGLANWGYYFFALGILLLFVKYVRNAWAGDGKAPE